MSFVSLGVATTLAWFVVLNAIMSLLVAAAAGRLLRRGLADTPANLAALRLAPAAIAALLVFIWVAPAFEELEPRHSPESIGVTLAMLAAFALAMVATALWRGRNALVRTSRTARTWMRRSLPLRVPGCPIPAFADQDEHAFVALVGVLRPRLFIGPAVRSTLTPEELSAVIAHEVAHHSTFDNFTRLVFASWRDVLSLTSTGRLIEQSWRAAAERSADARAIAGDRRRAMHLASALVKVARLVPDESATPVLCSTLHDTTQEGLLPNRVRRLLAPDPPTLGSSLPAIACAMSIVAAAFVCAPIARPIVHEMTELLVRMLP